MKEQHNNLVNLSKLIQMHFKDKRNCILVKKEQSIKVLFMKFVRQMIDQSTNKLEDIENYFEL